MQKTKLRIGNLAYPQPARLRFIGPSGRCPGVRRQAEIPRRNV